MKLILLLLAMVVVLGGCQPVERRCVSGILYWRHGVAGDDDIWRSYTSSGQHIKCIDTDLPKAKP